MGVGKIILVLGVGGMVWVCDCDEEWFVGFEERWWERNNGYVGEVVVWGDLGVKMGWYFGLEEYILFWVELGWWRV